MCPTQKQEKIAIKDFLDLKGKGFKGSTSPTKLQETDSLIIRGFDSDNIPIRKIENSDKSETILAFLMVNINGKKEPTELRITQRWLSCFIEAIVGGLNPENSFHQKCIGKAFELHYQFIQS